MLKELIEKRNDLLDERDGILAKAQDEKRAFNDEERIKIQGIIDQIKAIDESIALSEEMRAFEKIEAKEEKRANEDIETIETRMFADYVRGKIDELRAGEQNLTTGNNGAVIPVTIANRIIDAIKDRCPIFAQSTIYRVKGTLKIPVWGKANSTHDIAVGYATEFQELTADSGKFTSIDLSGYLVGCLVLLSKSLLNNSDIAIRDFIVDKMADYFADFIEREMLVGTGTNAMQGITVGCTNTKTTAAAAAITMDELIGVQCAVKQAYQKGAIWIMAPSTFEAIIKLKDSQNRYYLNDHPENGFPYRLLGKPVYLSDNMPVIAASAKTVVYGNMKAMAVNIHEDIELTVLREKYHTQHALGIDGWCEMDSKFTNQQMVAVLVQKSS